ncbi:hypothetical protein DIPPA_15287 [Diplonema papillatum]|nr:hypothetical protein DIPPA_15287 [Diplonema papillatum]
MPSLPPGSSPEASRIPPPRAYYGRTARAAPAAAGGGKDAPASPAPSPFSPSFRFAGGEADRGAGHHTPPRFDAVSFAPPYAKKVLCPPCYTSGTPPQTRAAQQRCHSPRDPPAHSRPVTQYETTHAVPSAADCRSPEASVGGGVSRQGLLRPPPFAPADVEVVGPVGSRREVRVGRPLPAGDAGRGLGRSLSAKNAQRSPPQQACTSPRAAAHAPRHNNPEHSQSLHPPTAPPPSANSSSSINVGNTFLPAPTPAPLVRPQRQQHQQQQPQHSLPAPRSPPMPQQQQRLPVRDRSAAAPHLYSGGTAREPPSRGLQSPREHLLDRAPPVGGDREWNAEPLHDTAREMQHEPAAYTLRCRRNARRDDSGFEPAWARTPPGNQAGLADPLAAPAAQCRTPKRGARPDAAGDPVPSHFADNSNSGGRTPRATAQYVTTTPTGRQHHHQTASAHDISRRPSHAGGAEGGRHAPTTGRGGASRRIQPGGGGDDYDDDAASDGGPSRRSAADRDVVRRAGGEAAGARRRGGAPGDGRTERQRAPPPEKCETGRLGKQRGADRGDRREPCSPPSSGDETWIYEAERAGVRRPPDPHLESVYRVDYTRAPDVLPSVPHPRASVGGTEWYWMQKCLAALAGRAAATLRKTYFARWRALPRYFNTGPPGGRGCEAPLLQPRASLPRDPPSGSSPAASDAARPVPQAPAQHCSRRQSGGENDGSRSVASLDTSPSSDCAAEPLGTTWGTSGDEPQAGQPRLALSRCSSDSAVGGYSGRTGAQCVASDSSQHSSSHAAAESGPSHVGTPLLAGKPWSWRAGAPAVGESESGGCSSSHASTGDRFPEKCSVLLEHREGHAQQQQKQQQQQHQHQQPRQQEAVSAPCSRQNSFDTSFRTLPSATTAAREAPTELRAETWRSFKRRAPSPALVPHSSSVRMPAQPAPPPLVPSRCTTCQPVRRPDLVEGSESTTLAFVDQSSGIRGELYAAREAVRALLPKLTRERAKAETAELRCHALEVQLLGVCATPPSRKPRDADETAARALEMHACMQHAVLHLFFRRWCKYTTLRSLGAKFRK